MCNGRSSKESHIYWRGSTHFSVRRRPKFPFCTWELLFTVLHSICRSCRIFIRYTSLPYVRSDINQDSSTQRVMKNSAYFPSSHLDHRSSWASSCLRTTLYFFQDIRKILIGITPPQIASIKIIWEIPLKSHWLSGESDWFFPIYFQALTQDFFQEGSGRDDDVTPSHKKSCWQAAPTPFCLPLPAGS